MSAVRASPLVHGYVSPSSWKGDRSYSLFQRRQGSCSSLSFRRLPRTGRRLRCGFGARTHRAATPVRAGPTDQALVAEPGRQEGVDSSGEILFEETFPLNRVQKVEGKVSVKLDPELENGGGMRKLVIGCNLEGNWVLHWGVTYRDDSDSEWDVPPASMIPAGSVPIKDYAMETPLKRSRPDLKGNTLNEVTIAVDLNSPVAAIHFVLKEEDTGNWYHNQGRDFSIHLLKSSHEEVASTAGKKHVGILKGAASKISNLIMESNQSQEDHGIKSHVEDGQPKNYPCIEELYEEYPIIKEEITQKSATISVTKSANKGRYFLHFDTDIPGKIILHWGVCKDNSNKWEILGSPYPPHTRVFRNKALRTLLQQKSGEVGSWTILPLERGIQGFSFLLKLEDGTWLRDMGNDFYIPLSTVDDSFLQSSIEKESMEISREQLETNEIINDIRNLVTDISSEKKMITTSKEAQESILEEIEKLAAEAYSIFRSTTPAFVEDIITETERSLRVPSAAGSGYEILCQGFNWESHSSGKWYRHLRDKVGDLYNIGFTGVWLPPPTESVSPQGYMPKDLYNLNSSYGSLDDLKNLINKFHEFDINVIGDVVLNHRCAHFQNSNGVWNIFGGQLNWDDRAVVCDDPHFQGRGNKSSGEQFHAAPNIDHSQEFVRNDLKDWLLWLRDDIGFDGWRLDFVRGFWGGYTKDYMEASKPHFAVGEFWDSLSYTYGQMDHNQDAHRQRIIDWINATNGTSAAFDITTKGIFHVTLENCEYWRLSDSKGKPPGLLGWWPSRAVTFIENHDTGSTQGHWRFPCGKEMQGYAYILTHPGTPSVFCDHVFSHLQQEIAHLISIRRRLNINCRSSVKIKKAERDVYAAEIDEKLVMKIGPGHYEPHGGSSRWMASAEGRDYKIWELA